MSQDSSLRISALLGSFDAFCYEAATQDMGHAKDGVDPLPVALSIHEFQNQALVDLGHAEGKCA